MTEEGDLEGLAAELRRLAGLGEDDLVLAPTIAKRLGVPIRMAPTLQAAACLAVVDGQFRIYLRGVGSDSNFDVAHELGHYALRSLARYDGPQEERYANYVAAAVLAPPPIVREAHQRYGALKAIRPLAKTTLLSQTAAQLRLGEVIGDERAVVTASGNVLIRTRGAFPWAEVSIIDADDRTFRSLGLAKTTLRGGIDTGRVALRAR